MPDTQNDVHSRASERIKEEVSALSFSRRFHDDQSWNYDTKPGIAHASLMI